MDVKAEADPDAATQPAVPSQTRFFQVWVFVVQLRVGRLMLVMHEKARQQTHEQ